MREAAKFYIGGEWVAPQGDTSLDVVNPATEEAFGKVSLGNQADVDRAVIAARKAFDSYSRTSRTERIELLENVMAAYRARRNDLAEVMTLEMGAPNWLSSKLHAKIGHVHLKVAQNVLREYPFEEVRGGTKIIREPAGVCALITPWNWPINQIAAKVAPALACGCTMVLKPSEMTPFSATIWAEVMEAAGVPAGVFNLVHGTGSVVGVALSSHPQVDVVSITGSTAAGIDVARHAAATIKRVHQELGGKSPNVILPDADIEHAVAAGVMAVAQNSGQSCNAPTRMLVPNDKMAEAIEAARKTVAGLRVDRPELDPDLGPVASRAQFDKVQNWIARGIADGAQLIAGGPGRPEHLEKGFYVRPTVFANVDNTMPIAQEEVFGPVLVMIGYDTVDEAVRIANDSVYGLAGYVQGRDLKLVADVASRLRVGQVFINDPLPDAMAPFGGFKQSGNGREWGDHGFEGFIEIKAMIGAVDVAEKAELHQ
jgi:aldehyde dehydrogenase (NAD+)